MNDEVIKKLISYRDTICGKESETVIQYRRISCERMMADLILADILDHPFQDEEEVIVDFMMAMSYYLWNIEESQYSYLFRAGMRASEEMLDIVKKRYHYEKNVMEKCKI